MGKIVQGVLGGFSGKVGAVIGSKWKSVYYMRGLTDKVHDRKSLKQQAQRAKFAVAQAFAHDVLGFARLGYSPSLGNRTPYNGLVSYLLSHAMTGSGVDWELDFMKVMVSRGPLKPVKIANAVIDGDVVNFTWTNNAGIGDAQAADVAMVLAYNKDEGEAEFDTHAAVRGDGCCSLTLPAGWGNANMAVYLGFRNEETGNCADSMCLINKGTDSSSGNSGGSTQSGTGSGIGGGSGSGGNSGEGGDDMQI
jgi:uncharacterized membrane protein YgcG